MWVKTRHKIVFAILVPFFRLYFRIRYNLKIKRISLEKKPYLILSNHQTTLDPFIIGVSFRRPVYFMASDDLFNKKVASFWIRTLVAPIPKSKATNDMQAIKDCIRVAGEGGTICIFPEGNRTYSGELCHIDPSIVKLIKILRIPVALYNIRGGYGTDPRWGKGIRKGKMTGETVRIITEEEIRQTDNAQLFDEIVQALKVEEAPTNICFKSKGKAERLERVLYLCPQCGKVSTLKSEGNRIVCTNCKLEAEYQEDLSFRFLKGKCSFKNVSDWYQFQIEYVKHYDINRSDIIFTDEDVHLFENIRCRRRVNMNFGRLSMTNEALILKGQLQETRFTLEDIYAMTAVGKHKLHFYIGQHIYQLKGNEAFNVLKYMQMYYHIRHVKNGDKDDFFGI